MFTDYLPLLLINMVVAFVALAFFFWKGLDSPNPKHWAAIFAVTGLVALVVGGHLAIAWPITEMKTVNLRFANIAFGEPTVMLGAVLLGAALSLAMNWSLMPLSIYAFFAGIVSVVIGAQIYNLGLTAAPTMTAAGFIISGLAAVASPLVLAQKNRHIPRWALSIILMLAALLWLAVGCLGYWGHLAAYSGKIG